MDDVHALVEERLGELLALGGVAPRVVATPTKVPVCRRRGIPAEQFGGLPMRSLWILIPAYMPSMNRVTPGNGWPPYVPILPVSLNPAAR